MSPIAADFDMTDQYSVAAHQHVRSLLPRTVDHHVGDEPHQASGWRGPGTTDNVMRVQSASEQLPMTSVSASNTISGRSAFIELLKSEGVTHLFGNPGTTELPIMHALADYPEMRYVLGLQEAIVIAMADGYARASGKLVACNVHVAPGLGNAMGSLFTAFNSGTPLIVTAGQQEQGHGLTEPLLYAPLVPIATPVVKWATEVTRLEDLPRIVHRAAKVATTPPTGPVFISLPGDILNAFGAIDLGQATRVDTRVRPSDEGLRALALRLLDAKRPVIIAGHEIVVSDAFAEAAQFAEVLGCPVYDQTVLQGAHFPSEHSAYLGPLSRDQKTVRGRLEPFDTVISLGSDFLRMSVYSESSRCRRMSRSSRSDCAIGRWARTIRRRSRCAPISRRRCAC